MIAHRIRALVAAASLSLAALAGCSDAPSSGECEKLLDRIVELEVEAIGAEEAAGEDHAKDFEKQKKELKESVKDEFMEQCKDETPGSFVACAVKKKSLEEMAECDKS